MKQSKRKHERVQEKERIGKQARKRTRQTERKPETGKCRVVQANEKIIKCQGQNSEKENKKENGKRIKGKEENQKNRKKTGNWNKTSSRLRRKLARKI